MRGGQSGDGDAEGGAADVVEADRVAELDRLRVAAVFAADAALEVRVRLAAELHAHADQLPDAAEVDRLERVALEQLLLDVLGQEDAGVDRKSTRLNSSHSQISYAVFCLKKKK